MIAFFQQLTEFDVILRLVNSGGIIAALAYAFSIERRLARIEGSIKCVCRLSHHADKEE